MNTEKIKWGIIGCGEVAEKKSGPAFNKVPNSSLVAIMRRDANKAADYAQRHGVPRWYSDASELIADPEVNAIYIATPPNSHLMYTRMALEVGKPVYVEKPMVLNTKEAKEMHALANQYADKIVVAHYRRWWPKFQKVKQLLEEGAIGEVLRVHLVCTRKPLSADEMQKPGVQWRINPAISGGGLFHDLAPHQLDLLLYWFGEVADCRGFAINHAKTYQAEDTVIGSIQFKSGIPVFGLWHFASPVSAQEDYVLIEGENGTLRFSIFWEDDISLNGASGTSSFTINPPENNQIFLIEQVVKFLRGEAPNPCPVADALKGVQMMDTLVGTPDI